MSVVYLGAGVFLLAGNNIFDFSEFQRIGLGLILITYGCFRFYSALKKKRAGENDELEE